MAEVRALHQMRCTLPVEAPSLPSRPFRPGIDDEGVLSVNNRAFARHPDQGGWTLDDLRRHFDEVWFDPDGLRVHERDGRIIGFCWTKVHRNPDLGEIYVIGIDPDHHGQGLGGPMTAAGLQWLAERGLETGMLYVEADNTPALRTYERLGFVRFRTDRAWSLAVG
jgi:mycothiol synthase